MRGLRTAKKSNSTRLWDLRAKPTARSTSNGMLELPNLSRHNATLLLYTTINDHSRSPTIHRSNDQFVIVLYLDRPNKSHGERHGNECVNYIAHAISVDQLYRCESLLQFRRVDRLLSAILPTWVVWLVVVSDVNESLGENIQHSTSGDSPPSPWPTSARLWRPAPASASSSQRRPASFAAGQTDR
jgi:hypothetical protein